MPSLMSHAERRREARNIAYIRAALTAVRVLAQMTPRSAGSKRETPPAASGAEILKTETP